MEKASFGRIDENKKILFRNKIVSIPFLFSNKILMLFDYLNNLHYRTIANIHKEAKIFSTGKVINIRNIWDAIRVGSNTIVRGELLTFGHAGSIEIGEWCYIGENTRIWSAEKVSIGDRVLISHNVNIHDCDAHPIDPEKRHQHFYQISTTGHPRNHIEIVSRPVVIEDDVWIGFNAIILKGVTIGKGSIVGAGSVVTKNVPSSVIVAGNPAIFIRKVNKDEYFADSRKN